MIKKILAFATVTTIILSLLGCSNNGGLEVSEETTNYVGIELENGSTVKVELYPDTAPVTVENFKNLVAKGFYDGLTFHRVIDGFMIQGGDPKGDGTGGAANKIFGEFLKNGFNNELTHTAGVLSMARSMENNSASSQFFIMVDAAPHLDGSYAAFGKVYEGMDAVYKIATETKVEDANGKVSKENQPKIRKIVFLKDK